MGSVWIKQPRAFKSDHIYGGLKEQRVLGCFPHLHSKLAAASCGGLYGPLTSNEIG